MNGCLKHSYMLHFIHNPKGKPSKYLGMSSQYLVEILDNDPALLKALRSKTSKKIYTPSDKSRFMGTQQRMVLMSKHDDGIFTLCKKRSTQGYSGIEFGIVNLPDQSLSLMLKEAADLAKLRWPKAPLFIRLNYHADITNLKLILENLGWTEDKNHLSMEKIP